MSGDRVLSAIDAKPECTTRLRRLVNVRASPHVALLLARYDDDWSGLWWARATGTHASSMPAMTRRGTRSPCSPSATRSIATGHRPVLVLAVTDERWSGWRAAAG